MPRKRRAVLQHLNGSVGGGLRAAQQLPTFVVFAFRAAPASAPRLSNSFDASTATPRPLGAISLRTFMTQPTDFYARYLEALARKAELGARFLNALVSFLRNSAIESEFLA
jgi:hypothetical protein